MNLSKKIKKGFTLIELLLVVAILSILLVVVFAALNPAERLADTRQARRWSDVNNVLTAVHTCLVDNEGTESACGDLDTLTDGTTYEITNAAIATGCDASCGVAAADCVDFQTDLVSATPSYLGSLPADPGGETGGTPATDHTHYGVTMNSGIVTISACNAVSGEAISVSR